MDFPLLQVISERQRIYQLPYKCKVFPTCPDVSNLLLENDPPSLIQSCILAEDFSEGIDKVCISDAHTHIERLVFPAFFVKNRELKEITLTFTRNQIAGCLTFMMYGGDRNSIRHYHEYLQEIVELNPR